MGPTQACKSSELPIHSSFIDSWSTILDENKLCRVQYTKDITNELNYEHIEVLQMPMKILFSAWTLGSGCLTDTTL